MDYSSHLRASALGLVAGTLCFTMADVLRRLVDSSAAASSVSLTAAVADRPGLWLTAALLSAFAPLLALTGLAGVVATAHGRGARLTVVGAGLAAAGQVAAVGHAVAFYSPVALYGDAGTDPSQVRALDRASEQYPLLVALIAVFIAGTVLGTLLLFVGLRRAGRVPIWAVVAAVVFVVCGSSGGVVPGIIGVLAGLAAFVPAARAVAQAATGAAAGSDAGVGRRTSEITTAT